MHPLTLLALHARRPKPLPAGFAFFLANTNDGQHEILSCGHIEPKTRAPLFYPYPQTPLVACATCRRLQGAV